MNCHLRTSDVDGLARILALLAPALLFGCSLSAERPGDSGLGGPPEESLVGLSEDQAGGAEESQLEVAEAKGPDPAPCAPGRLAPGYCRVNLLYDSLGQGTPMERHYDLYLPPGVHERGPVPLLFLFHGYGGTPVSLHEQSGFKAEADEHGFAIAYPEGYKGSFNAVHCCGAAMREKLDDLGLTLAILKDVSARVSIDRKRIYAAGHSNGAGMAHLLACHHADVFAAIAPISANNPVAEDPGACAPSRPIPVNAFMGRQDYFNYQTGRIRWYFFWNEFYDNRYNVGFAGDFQKWGELNGCTEPILTTKIGVDPDTVCTRYTACLGGGEVVHCHLKAGHMQSQIFAEANKDGVDIAARAWDFLSRFSLDER